MSVTLQDIKDIYDKIEEHRKHTYEKIEQQRSDIHTEIATPLNNLATELGKVVASFNSHQKAMEKQEKAQSKITERLENVQTAQALEIAKLREDQTDYRLEIGKAITKIYTTQQGFLGVLNKVGVPLLLALQSAGALIIYLKMASG
jgi:putative component of toxin-antitoxin plasmid stabilization module